jgi:hypothetical protein
VRQCDTIVRTGLFFALFGAILGIGLATSQAQMLTYAAFGVWGGALAGALVGALRCVLSRAVRRPAPRSARSPG